MARGLRERDRHVYYTRYFAIMAAKYPEVHADTWRLAVLVDEPTPPVSEASAEQRNGQADGEVLWLVSENGWFYFRVPGGAVVVHRISQNGLWMWRQLRGKKTKVESETFRSEHEAKADAEKRFPPEKR